MTVTPIAGHGGARSGVRSGRQYLRLKLDWAAGWAVIAALARLLPGPLRMSWLVTRDVAGLFGCVVNTANARAGDVATSWFRRVHVPGSLWMVLVQVGQRGVKRCAELARVAADLAE